MESKYLLAGLVSVVIVGLAVFFFQNQGGGGGSLEATNYATQVVSCIQSGGQWVDYLYVSKCQKGYYAVNPPSLAVITSTSDPKARYYCCSPVPPASPSPTPATSPATNPATGGSCVYSNTTSCSGNQVVRTSSIITGTCTPTITTVLATCENGCQNAQCKVLAPVTTPTTPTTPETPATTPSTPTTPTTPETTPSGAVVAGGGAVAGNLDQNLVFILIAGGAIAFVGFLVWRRLK